MIRKTLLTVISLLTPLLAIAQQDTVYTTEIRIVADNTPLSDRAKEILLSTPLLPTFSNSDRLDMIDYHDLGLTHTVKSSLGEEGHILMGSDDKKITVTIDGRQTIEICPLPFGKSTIFLVINTITLPVSGADDSAVSFWTSDWQPLDGSKYMPDITLDDWQYRKLSADERADLEANVPFIMSQISFGPTNRTLTFAPHFDKYLSKEGQTMAGDCLKPALTLKWDGKKFKLTK